MQVYKYGAKHVLTMLSQQRIKISEASELNDPFELSPRIDLSQFTVESAMQFLRRDEHLNEWYAKEGRELGFTNKKRYKAHYFATLRKRAEALMPNVPSNVEAARANFAKTFSRHWRLFCTSLRRDSILMWSHYAANHTGALVEFRADHPPFSELGSEYVLPVTYSNDKPIFFYKSKRVADFTRGLGVVVKTKSIDWSYEQEVRFMFPTTALVENQFIPFPAHSVSSIVLGARMPDTEQRQYLNVASEARYSHVTVYTASLSKEHYSLEFTVAKQGSA